MMMASIRSRIWNTIARDHVHNENPIRRRHALKVTLLAQGTLSVWQTAVLYQLLHSVALLALAGWRDSHAGPSAKVGACWVTVIVLFSGSLYGLALGGPKFLGPVTPLGGLAFLIGWALIVWNALRQPKT